MNIESKMNIESTILKVKALEKEYEVVLNKYKEALNNYINTLDSKVYSELKGRTWWGALGLEEGEVDSIEDCKKKCLNNEKCTGATFNTVNKYCWIRGGDGRLTTGSEDVTAIVPSNIVALEVLKKYNEDLLEINKNIIEELKKMEPELLEKDEIMKKQEKELTDYYNKLLDQKKEINKQLNEYNSLEESNKEQSLFAQQKNGVYKMWLMITIILIVLVVKTIIGYQMPLVDILIVILIVSLSYLLRTPMGLMIMFLIIYFIIMFINNNNQ